MYAEHNKAEIRDKKLEYKHTMMTCHEMNTIKQPKIRNYKK